MLRCPRTHSGRASARLGRSVCTVTTVGAHRRRLHGRPRTGHASSVLRLDVRPELGLWGASTIMLLAWRSSVTVCPCPLENTGPDDIRRTQPSCRRPAPHGATSPVTGAAGTHTSSGGTGPRAATLALTSPARIPAGQRANIPKLYLCVRAAPGAVPPHAGVREAYYESAAPDPGSGAPSMFAGTAEGTGVFHASAAGDGSVTAREERELRSDLLCRHGPSPWSAPCDLRSRQGTRRVSRSSVTDTCNPDSRSAS